jgi:alpha-glutamyl/putrescinyl thymine pyrophosphorylase clade 1
MTEFRRLGVKIKPLQRFFDYAVEREAIRIRRAGGAPRPWTTDPVLQKYRFCNVFREDDRTTKWFRDNVRDPLRNKPEVLLATVLFRWFNRISVGEAVFLQGNLFPRASAWDEYLVQGSTTVLRQSIKTYCGNGPYVTGSYTVLGCRGLPKLEGCLWGVDQFNKKKFLLEEESVGDVGWRDVAAILLSGGDVHSLKWIWEWLRQFPYIGDFVAYEIVTDLRHTALLEEAHDIMTWANPGPGAFRGLNRILRPTVDIRSRVHRKQAIEEMHDILQAARQGAWPVKIEGEKTRPWEMREVEHTLCEFDKWERVHLGQGRPRGVIG